MLKKLGWTTTPKMEPWISKATPSSAPDEADGKPAPSSSVSVTPGSRYYFSNQLIIQLLWYELFTVYEVFERMAYYGISTNLIIYLTKKLHQGTVTSANNVTNWSGTVWIMPILGAYVADAHLGRYRTFLVASAICLTVCFLTNLSLSRTPKVMKVS